MPHTLVPSDRVERANVYGRDGAKLLRAGPSEFDEDDFDWGDRSRSYPHPHYWTV
jgi:hypothetical protein